MHNIFGKGGSIIGYSLLGIIIFLNFFSGIISGVWLIVLGMWSQLLLGVFYSFVMPFAYTIAALPPMLLMPLLLKFSENGNKVMTAILGFINVIYSDLIILFWTYFIFVEFVSEASGAVVIPLVLWGYTTVVAPLGYMAKGEQDSIGTSLGIYFAQISYIALVVLWIVGAADDTVYLVLGGLTLLFALFPTWLTLSIMKQNTERADDGSPVRDSISGNDLETQIREAEVEDVQKFCVNCGKDIAFQAEYCRFCGFKK